MTYFADGEKLYYHRGPLDADSWKCSVVAIGWLEYPNVFRKGPYPDGATKVIEKLRAQFREAFPGSVFRGYHECSICAADESGAPYLPESHVNLFVPGDAILYVAPGRIDHYIESHGYCPPPEFTEALHRCPDPRTHEYRKLLKILNHGEHPPLLPGEWGLYQVDSNGNRRLLFDFPTEAQAWEAAQAWVDAHKDVWRSHKQQFQFYVEHIPKHAVAGDESELE